MTIPILHHIRMTLHRFIERTTENHRLIGINLFLDTVDHSKSYLQTLIKQLGERLSS
jgi:hypothetical protein